jgi:hypothetical protein
MATICFNDGFFSVTGTDLSDHVKAVTINYEAEAQDDTAMGDDTRSNKGGLKSWSMDVEFHQDYAAAQVDATVFPLVGTTVVVDARPVATGGRSATNPSFTGTGMIQSYNPISGSVGDLMGTSISVVSAGTLSRATS